MNDPRGSIWRKWDLHVHTPGTKKNDQYTNQKSYDEALDFYCDKIEQSNVAVFGITDYFSADSYFAFIEKFRKKHPDSSNADLRRFREESKKQFATWASSLDPHQSHTDILGALDAARQESASLPKESDSKLVVVSDFLEDDGTYRFVSADSLANPARARHLAARLRAEHEFTLPGVSVCLGRLESGDFAPLSVQRKEAIQAFWTAYFAAEGESAKIQFDSTGILADADRDCPAVGR